VTCACAVRASSSAARPIAHARDGTKALRPEQTACHAASRPLPGSGRASDDNFRLRTGRRRRRTSP
jgi:hypothetical protein